MIATTQCPPIEELRRYSLGNYTDEEGDLIEQHLTQCKSCEQTLAQFDDTGDSLVRHLPLTRRRAPDDSEEDSGWLRRLMNPSVNPEVPPIGNAESSDAPTGKDSFGAYELTGVLGKGGMGVVYAARHQQLGRSVAVKVVNPRLVAASDAQRRFDREIQILGKLDHPGIVAATDAGRIAGAAYLVMERIDGIDLATLVRNSGPLSISEACEVTRQIALALAAAHDSGAVHRDVKPSNVMVDREGRVKLLDFGLAHLSDSISNRSETSFGRLLGTLDYMAPEQADGNGVTSAVDLHGLGATLFFLLTGRPPKVSDRSESLISQLRSVADGEAPRLDEIRADVPSELSDLVEAMLARDPADRPQDASEIARTLTQWNDDHSPEPLLELVAAIPKDTDEDDESKRDVAQSLNALLGRDAVESTVTGTNAPVAHGKASRRFAGRIIAIGLALAGLIPLIYFGIVLLIETPTGTVRIESEVAGVTVELLDENERVEKLEVTERGGETQLKAGKYRVRIAGGHDSLMVEPDVIVLAKDETQVARVSMEPNAPGVATKATVEKHVSNLQYQGEPLAVWQRRFDVETNPVSKLEAAKALIALSESMTAENRIELILNLGSQIVLGGWGDDPGEYFPPDRPATHTRLRPTRWSRSSYPDLVNSLSAFNDQAESIADSLPPKTVASAITESVTTDSGARAIFATDLLLQLQSDALSENADVIEMILDIRLPETSPLRVHLCTIQFEYFPHGTSETQTQFSRYASSVGESIATTAFAENQYAAAAEWLGRKRVNGVPLRDNVFGQVALKMLLADPEETLSEVFEEKWMSTGEFAYPDEWMINAWNRGAELWDQWLPVLNEWLTEHPDPSRESGIMIDTLNIVLRGRKSENDWPVERLAELLTQRIGRRMDLPEDEIPAESESMHDLLAYLVLAGGEIPKELLDREVPASDKSLQSFAHLLTLDSNEEFENRQRLGKQLKGLVALHPVSVTRLAFNRDGDSKKYQPVSMIALVSDRGNGDDSPPPIEPLLLLATLVELAGQSDLVDDRIAYALEKTNRHFSRHIDDALDYPYAIREIAEKLLRRMRDAAVSEQLIETLDKLLPGEAKDRAEFVEKNPDSLLAMMESYNDKTRDARTVKFDPPIPELQLPQVVAAFESAARRYEKSGKSGVAAALRRSAKAKRLTGGLESRGGVTGTQLTPKESGKLMFKQFLPAVIYNPKVGNLQILAISELELRWSRDGWSSPDWGQIHPPITGEWKLVEVKRGDSTLDDDQLTTWKQENARWIQLAIGEDTLTMKSANPPQQFDLAVDYSSMLATYELRQSGVVKFAGVFMGNGFIDNTQLKLAVSLNGSTTAESFKTEGTNNIRLKYERMPTANAKPDSDDAVKSEPDYPPSPEFPPVKITVVSEDGKPLSGTSVTMRKLTSDGRSVKLEVDDTSGNDGVAISRILPYGDYYTFIKTAAGWYASIRRLPVEFAKGLDLTIVAPSPKKSAMFEIASAPDFSQLENLKELRFGVLERHHSSRSRGWSPQRTPEPSDDVGDYESFPSLGRGIDEVVVSIKLEVNRLDIAHPIASAEEDQLKWTWVPEKLASRQFLVGNGSARLVEDVDSLHCRPTETSPWFKIPSDRHKVGAVQYKLGEAGPLPMKISVPAGQATVLLTDFYGRPSDEVTRSLKVDRERKPSFELWLDTNIVEDSQWASRITQSEDWFYSRPKSSYYGHTVRQEKQLVDGDTLSISLGSKTTPR